MLQKLSYTNVLNTYNPADRGVLPYLRSASCKVPTLVPKPVSSQLKPPEEWMQRVGAFTGLPELIRELGGDPAAILGHAGLGVDALRDPDDRVPYAAIALVLDEAARRTRCPHLGLLVGRMWNVTDIGLTGEIIQNSRTVGDGLRAHVVHQHMNSEGGLSFLLERGGTVDLG